jgi:4-hydroxy-3-methylbut-2-enyl diphosphate reductase
MPTHNDVMIIIGSKNSANTKRLYEIAKSINPRSYWVSSKDEIKPVWFKGMRNVGVTAGASTPEYTTKGVIAYLKKIA